MAKKRAVDEEMPVESLEAPVEESPAELPPPPVVVPVAAPSIPQPGPETVAINRYEFLKHVRRLLIGSTDRMVTNGTRRTVRELTGLSDAEVDALVDEAKRLRM